jgi:hypothetical protein
MHLAYVVRKSSFSFSRLALISSCSTNLALISSRIFFKAKTSLSKLMHEVQMRPHEQVSSFTPIKASSSSSSQEVCQASFTRNKEHLLQGMDFISQISALACSRSSTHVV